MREISLLNAAAGLVISGNQPDLVRGIAAAASAIDSGKTRQTLETLIAALIFPVASRTGAATQRMRSSFSSRSKAQPRLA